MWSLCRPARRSSSPERWPGVHAAVPLLSGKPAVGKWIDRSRFWAEKKHGEKKLADFMSVVRVPFAKLPTMHKKTDSEYRGFIAGLLEQIRKERREKVGNKPSVGRKRLCKRDAWKERTPLRARKGCSETCLMSAEVAARTKKRQRRAAPRLHCQCLDLKRQHRVEYDDFVAARRAGAAP